MPSIIELIRKKRDGKTLGYEEISSFIEGVVSGKIPDYQVSAFLMAVFIRGLNEKETFALTESMIKSGKTIDLYDIPGPKIDKHSTGGVGDKVSIVLAPLVASCGIRVPMISGRALGHTGGTLDKLESIPGYQINLSIEEWKEILKEVGCSIIGQTEEIAPADRILYALRDATGTVESIPLITASIMSKKLSEGIDGLILDVKTGRGAFLPEVEKARELAELMVKVGNKYGVKTVALITNMDTPLGYQIGNALEIYECIEFLRGRDIPDIREVTFALGSYMLILGNLAENFEQGIEMIEEVWKNGKGFKTFLWMIQRQSANLNFLDSLEKWLEPEYKKEVMSNKEGYINIDARKIGEASRVLGAGRERREDKIYPKAGITLYKKYGDYVWKGDKIFELYSDSLKKIEDAEKLVKQAISFSKEKLEQKGRIIEIVGMAL